MVLTYSIENEIGKVAPDFSLRGVDEKSWSLANFQDAKILVVVFMCNHCPYVGAIQGRLNDLAKEFLSRGVRVVGINSNDPDQYPKDNFETMKEVAKENNFVFPYLFDETQNVAKAYDAVCTPDIFAFENVEKKFILRYHGRLDDNWKNPKAVTRRELALALEEILAGKQPAIESQRPSMGCNIKWKEKLPFFGIPAWRKYFMTWLKEFLKKYGKS